MIRRVLVLMAMLVVAALASAANDPLETAKHEFEAADYAAANKTLRAALERAPQDARVYYWLGRCAFEQRDFDNAITHAERAVRLDPQNSEYHYWLGRAYGEKADRERSFFLGRKTKAEFEEAVRLNPSNIRARRDLMEYYADAPWIVGGSKKKARQQVEAIAALEPLEGHLARAEYWRYENELGQAEAEYRRVLELKPNRVEPYLDVADFYLRRNDAAHMEEAVEAAARVKPAERQLGFYRGVVRIVAGNRLPEAERFLKSYLATAMERSDLPSHASALEWLGRLYEKMGKCDQAAAQFRAALEREPDSKGAREGLKRVQKRC